MTGVRPSSTGPLRLTAELALDLQAVLGEGPVWDAATATLFLVDILGERMHRFEPASGVVHTTAVNQPLGAVVLDRSGRLLAMARDGIAVLSGDEMTIVAGIEGDDPRNRMNDAKCDPEGRLWVGTMALDFADGAGSLYRVEPDFTSEKILGGLTVANGMAWSRDGHTMYFIDSTTYGVDAFDFDQRRGEISNRRPFVNFHVTDGLPDGMTIDADGCIWVALYGGGCVRRYSPDGEHLATIDVPVSHVTSCAFGGSDLADLYITTAAYGLTPEQRKQEPWAGGLFRCRPGAVGVPAVRFADALLDTP